MWCVCVCVCVHVVCVYTGVSGGMGVWMCGCVGVLVCVRGHHSQVFHTVCIACPPCCSFLAEVSYNATCSLSWLRCQGFNRTWRSCRATSFIDRGGHSRQDFPHLGLSYSPLLQARYFKCLLASFRARLQGGIPHQHGCKLLCEAPEAHVNRVPTRLNESCV